MNNNFEMPEADGLGVTSSMAQNLNPGYANQLFTNIQQAQAGLRRRNQQQVADNTGRFGQMGSGMQQQLLAQGNQGISDSALQAAGGAAAQGAQMNQQNRQFNAGLQAQALQAQIQKSMMERQLQQQNEMFYQERADSMQNSMMNLGGKMALGLGA